jgi:cytochrome c biogenesis factor
LALNERQQHFDELIKCSQINDHGVKDKIENLIQMWNQLRSMSRLNKTPFIEPGIQRLNMVTISLTHVGLILFFLDITMSTNTNHEKKFMTNTYRDIDQTHHIRKTEANI